MKSLIVLLVVLAAVALVAMIGIPLIQGDSNKSRLKALRARREAFRAEVGAAARPKAVSLREKLAKKSLSTKLSERLNLSRFVNMDKLKTRLMLAGWRDPNTLPKFLVMHLILPFVVGGYMIFAVYGGPLNSSVTGMFKPISVIGGFALGLALPSILLSNAAQNRVKKLSKQFPDALDLMLVCVEAGLSIEQSFMRITEEIGDTVPEVAEEFALTGAELSFLGDRQLAYDNLTARTDMQEFKGLATALSQSEAYGTSVGGSLRALSEDSRKMRVLKVEKAAGALGPKMTVPMIIFVLPCMFMVLIGPSVIQVMQLK